MCISACRESPAGCCILAIDDEGLHAQVGDHEIKARIQGTHIEGMLILDGSPLALQLPVYTKQAHEVQFFFAVVVNIHLGGSRIGVNPEGILCNKRRSRKGSG